MMKKNYNLLVNIILSQFLCTSMWFAGNAIVKQLSSEFGLEGGTAHITSAVQFGFIVGTFIYAVFGFSDKYSPSKVFLTSALLGAVANLMVTVPVEGFEFESIITSRFLTGLFLAGIYPVGMKIAADHFEKGLGASLGFLVGALVLGTALPHLLGGLLNGLNWKYTIITTSGFAAIGGIIMVLFVPDGPFRKSPKKFDAKEIKKAFQSRPFRKAAIGYFGHMWELYTFWAFVPTILLWIDDRSSLFNHSYASFSIIAIGALTCAIGGIVAQKRSARWVALSSLSLSLVSSIMIVIALALNVPIVALIILVIWGATVIPDSPMFSTMVAQNAIAEYKGTALTTVNGIGFFITIISIQVVSIALSTWNSPWTLLLLAIGPIIGLWFNLKKD